MELSGHSQAYLFMYFIMQPVGLLEDVATNFFMIFPWYAIFALQCQRQNARGQSRKPIAN